MTFPEIENSKGNWRDRINASTRRWVEHGGTQAVVYVVLHHGEVVLRKAMGSIAPNGITDSVTCDSVFRMSSVSKVITAAVAMSLVENGQLSTARRVSHYLPEFRATSEGDASDDILVSHLLTHTSGLCSDDYNRILETRLVSPVGSRATVSQEDYLAAALATCPITPPGSHCRYAGVNFVLLGEIIARCDGKPFAKVAKERILAPLEMNSSGFGLSAAMEPLWVRADPSIYKDVEPAYDPNDIGDLRIAHPGGHLFSTADDMAVFCQMFLNGGQHKGKHVLSAATVAAMTSNQVRAATVIGMAGQTLTGACWGLGWMLQDTHPWKAARLGVLPSTSSFHHQGAAGVGVWVDPKHSIVGVYLSTIRSYDAVSDEYDWDFDLFQNMISAALIA